MPRICDGRCWTRWHGCPTDLLTKRTAERSAWRHGWWVWLSIAALSVKAALEERLLVKHFPEAYARYRRRVRAAVIPIVG